MISERERREMLEDEWPSEKKGKQQQAASGGVGVVGLLLVLFIALKLTKVIDWAWGWVLSPLWIPVALIVAGLIIYLIVVLIITAVKNKKDKER